MNRALWLLTIVNLLNYLDRYIMASVAPKVETEFALSHAQTGSLMSMFMIGYMLTSPLFGYFGDRKSRPVLMGIGILTWSAATFVSGMVDAFIPLILARAVVGIGEASYATISPPYIRDALKDERALNFVMGIFYTAIPVGAAVGYIWGGTIADHFNWRWAFYLGAVPGAILGILVWRLNDVPRASAVATVSSMPGVETLRGFWQNREYRYAVLGYIAYTFGIGGFSAWAPHYGVSVLGVSLAESSLKVGGVTLIAGLIGTLIGGKWGGLFVGDKSQSSGVDAARGFNRFCAWTSLIATPFAIWTFCATSMNEFMIAIFLVQVAMFAASAPVNTAILASVPSHVAATAFAVSIFSIHAFGDVISPPLVGVIADHASMQAAMSILIVAIFFSALVWFVGAKNVKA